MTRCVFMITVYCFIAGIADIYAQDNNEQKDIIKFKAQVRVREEIDRRDLNDKTGYDSYTFLRTRIGALITPVENYSAFIQFQDSRAFGKEKSPTDDTKNADLHQAYIFAKHFIWDKMDLKLGRMEISYGEERLLGRSNWGNTGRAFDGGLFTFNVSGPLTIDAFAFRLNENSPPPTIADTTAVSDTEDRDFTGLYLMYARSGNFKADIYCIGDVDHTKNTATNGNDSLKRATAGAFIIGGIGAFSYKSEAAFQTGKNNGKTISAFMLTGSAGYAFSELVWKPSVFIGCDYLSGDNDPADNTIRTFNTLYGSSRYYGGLDYFTDIIRHTGGLGLQDNMIKLKVKPVDLLSAALDYHYFLSARKNKTLNSRAFGNEIDLTITYQANKFVSFESGFGVMLPGKLLKDRFGNHGDTGTWGYFTTLFEY